METTASKMTIEHLGQDATEEDLENFRTAVARVQESRGISEQEATDIVWNNGSILFDAR